jgi:hypothetical protein
MSDKISRPLATFVKISQTTIDALVDRIVELSGRGDIRVTESGMYSVFDVISVVAGKGSVAKEWKRFSLRYPDTMAKCHSVKLSRSDGKKANMVSPVGDLATVIEIVWLLPGDFAAKFRKLGADIVSQVVERQVLAEDSKAIRASDDDVFNSLMATVIGLQQKIISMETQQQQDSTTQQVVNNIASEYVSVLKTAKSSYPGFFEMIQSMPKTSELPAVETWVTSIEYVRSRGINYTPAMGRRFAQVLAHIYRQVKRSEPNIYSEVFGYGSQQFVYSSKDEWILEQAYQTCIGEGLFNN